MTSKTCVFENQPKELVSGTEGEARRVFEREMRGGETRMWVRGGGGEAEAVYDPTPGRADRFT